MMKLAYAGYVFAMDLLNKIHPSLDPSPAPQEREAKWRA
jgi:hypothetical protein